MALRERSIQHHGNHGTFELSSARHTGCLLKAGLANISNPAPYQARIPELEHVRILIFS